MVQFIPAPSGLFPYPNAGRNDYQGFGSVLDALAGGLQKYKLIKDERKTVGDLVGPPATGAENPDYFRPGASVPVPSSLRSESMMSPLAALSGRSSGAMSSPTPMALPGPMDRLHAMTDPIRNMKLSDLKRLGQSSNILQLLAGPNPMDLLQKFYEIQHLQSQDELNQSRINWLNRGGAPGARARSGSGRGVSGTGSSALERIASQRTFDILKQRMMFSENPDTFNMEEEYRNLYPEILAQLQGKPVPGNGGPQSKPAANPKDTLGLF